jgi:citrate synthase
MYSVIELILINIDYISCPGSDSYWMDRSVVGREIEIRDGVIAGRALSDFGVVCYDPGFYNTASCRSSITHIEPDKGQLEFRGFPIEDLATSKTFMDVSHLLVRGVLPNRNERKAYAELLHRYERLPAEATLAVDALPEKTHPMVALQVALSALSARNSSGTDLGDQGMRLIGQLPTLVAYLHSGSRGISSREDFVARFLERCRGEEVEPELVRTLDIMFTLHADHEQNCSTNVVRAVLSAQGNLFAAAAAGIAALSGPLHGGANEAAIRMLEEIGSARAIPGFIASVVEKKQKLFGFGHPVYHTYDPRAAVLKGIVRSALKTAQVDNKLFETALELEDVALHHEYFMQRHLYPNVDFYSGLLYRALGFRNEEMTCLFAVARTSGWVAHALEQAEDPDSRIYRPRQLYDGPRRRSLANQQVHATS